MMHEHGFVADALAFGAYTEATEDRRRGEALEKYGEATSSRFGRASTL